MAVRTTLDFTIANGLRARRRLMESDAEAKLVTLRRVNKQFISGVLPRFTETNVEQSWNEQVFARVLGYQTQFSHDRLPFHMKAKDFRGGYFADFSLGFFGTERERVLVSAELKGPTKSLDAPQQGGSYKGLSPVQQAFRAAAEHPECQWVLISNFTELRLYRIADAIRPVATAFLPDVVDALDLAMLQSLLDRHALLGDGRSTPELVRMTNMAADDPGSPVAPVDGEYRLIMRFTPRGAQELPLFKAEQSLVAAIQQGPAWFRMFEAPGYGLPLRMRSRFSDGWVAVDGCHSKNGIVGRVAVSLLGQVQASFRFAAGSTQHDRTQYSKVEFTWILNGLRFFGGALEAIHPMQTVTGLFGAEIREARGKYLDIQSSLVASHGFNWGIAEIDDVLAGDFSWNGPVDTLTSIEAMCACELAAYFRTPEGGASASLDAVKADIDQMNARDRNYKP